MPLRAAIQMDAVETFKFATDTTLRLGLEAQARGHTLWYYTPDKLSFREGRITATAQRIHFHDNETRFFEVGAPETIDLRTMQVVLLRQDPPFDMAYLSTTYILERLAPDVLVVNDPASVRNNPEKLFPTLFARFMPPTLVTADPQEIERFRNEFKDIVIKPLYGYAGHAVTHLKPGESLEAGILAAGGNGREPLMVQPFLPEVKDSDRRIILIDGKIAGIMARIPAEGDFRGNFRVGGTAATAEITKRQREICEMLEPELTKRNLILAGLDVIGDYLTEINLTSPTGIPAMNRLYGLKLQAQVWDAIEARIPA